MKKTSHKKNPLLAEEKAKQKLRRILIKMTVLFVLAAILSLPPALFSFRMFDAHGATENPATILLFLSFFSFPAFTLISILLAWLFYKFYKFNWAYKVLLLPLLNISSALIALVWLQIAYDGLFGGKP
jgi:hypothetical protein